MEERSKIPHLAEASRHLVRVLLVDDEPGVRQLLARYLEDSQVGITEAGSGAEALRSLASSKPDLIVLDVNMPGMSGYEVCRTIRSRAETASIPIIVITGLDASDERIKALEAGATDFVTKPIRKHEFLVRVNNQLALQHARREIEHMRLVEEAEKAQHIREMFERYVSPRLVSRLLQSSASDGAKLLTDSRRCDAVVMFADLRGFTRMSEVLDPTLVVDVLNQFFALLVRVAHRYNGTVISMAGDCLLLAFGVPYPQPDGPTRALYAAMRMLTKFNRLAKAWDSRYGVHTGLGIGVNRGEVVAGNVGAPSYMNFTLIGDAVNVAARLKDRARAGEILFTEPVMRTLENFDEEAVITIHDVLLKGKSEPLAVFCIPVKQRIEFG